MLDGVIENAGIGDRFEAVLSADEMEIYKPAPAEYERAAGRLDEPLADCWLVTVNAWDAAGAAQGGKGVAWIDRAGDPRSVSAANRT